MSENTSENLPPKKPGIVRRITWAVKESLPWDPIRKKKRATKSVPDEVLRTMEVEKRQRKEPEPRIRILPDEEKNEPSTLPTLEQNIKASEQFIRQLRNPNRYSQDLHQPQYMKSDLGFLVTKPVENGWFDVASVVRAAEDRYQLPLAIYIDRSHAQLVVKGPYQTSQGRKITVYNPMLESFDEIRINETGMPVGVAANGLVGSKIVNGEYDIAKFFDSPELARYRNLLKDVKAFNFQRDYYNCIPYCLFVGAMLNGLESGDTPFKANGIRQFEQDFGVKILTREEILPKPRVRLV